MWSVEAFSKLQRGETANPAWRQVGSLRVALCDERVEEYAYKAGDILNRHNMTSYTEPNGNVTRYEYFGPEELFPGGDDRLVLHVSQKVRCQLGG